MLLSAVERALDEFLLADDPQIIALAGQWGRGKSYYWRTYFARRRSDASRVSSYAYVSLFGLKDLSDFRDALVASTVPLRGESEAPPSAQQSNGSLLRRGAKALKQIGRRAERTARSHIDLLDKLPRIGELGPLARAVAFRLVCDHLICIDDLERRSDSLSLRDVLGTLSMLREERRCRIIVILNIDALSEGDLALFHTLREKVFDSEIAFEPSAEECAAIAFPEGSRLYARAVGYCVQLGITNIRVLYRIRRLIDAVAKRAAAADDAIQRQIIHSSVLLGWCFNSRDGRAPSFSYVKSLSYARFMDFGDSKERPEHEKHWNQLLTDYGYTNTDNLDEALCEVLERGYVDTQHLDEILDNRTEAVRRARLEQAFSDAWSIYHGSFDPSAAALAAAFESSMKEGAEVISLLNASSATLLLRSLGYENLADELMRHWIEVNARVRPQVLDVASYDWKSEIRDLRFSAEAQRVFVTLATATDRTFRDIAIQLVAKNGWSERDIQVLAAASVDEYLELFKILPLGEAKPVIRQFLRFGTFNSVEQPYAVIAERTRAALVRIGRESLLNRLRVEAYGVDPDSELSPDADHEPSTFPG